MKKIFLTIAVFMLMLMSIACTKEKITYKKHTNVIAIGTRTNANKASLKLENAKFKYFYRGFNIINQKIETQYPKDTVVIETEKDWHDFMDKFVPGIPYYLKVNYSKESLIANVTFPAKPTYTAAIDIKAFTIKSNKLEAKYVYDKNRLSSGIYVENSDKAQYCFFNIVKVEKKYVPLNIKNIYHKK